MWIVHNLGLTDAEAEHITERSAEDGMWASDDPLRRMSVFLGDFNLPGGASRANYEFPLPGDVAPAGGQHRRQWHKAWEAYTEVSN